MRILVIGSGGREHALCQAIAASPLLERLWCAPGNGGIEDIADCIALDAGDHESVIAFSRRHDIDLVVIGPEQPLVAGLADDLEKAGIAVFGPSRAAARLEGSKAFAKALCARHDIPTAAWQSFDDPEAARAALDGKDYPLVLKADGLAAGKGVLIAQNRAEADAAIESLFGGRFGEAGARIVIEEFLEGTELSFFALSDGETVLPLGGAEDHKQVGEGDTGPNTGGMGAYSPSPLLDLAMQGRIMDEIVIPTIAAMRAEGTPFRGVLFAGLMLTASGPKLIEYNVRFGDPECQVLMMRLASDIVPLLAATAAGDLALAPLPRFHEGAAIAFVMAARGYPGPTVTGSEIRGLEKAATVTGVRILHAGTKREEGRFLATGGRVLNVCAIGRDLEEARSRALTALGKIDWPDGFYRRDIGCRGSLPRRR
ncbi:MAG: phosphoribosylamine--glycine ligase [Rhodothalassiaceae bacterium]